MNHNRKDQDVRNRQSKTDQADGMRDQQHRGERNRSSESSTSGDRSALDSKESFEHGTRQSEMTRGMAESGERGFSPGAADRDSSATRQGGISNRGRDEERARQERLPERGRSQSEE